MIPEGQRRIALDALWDLKFDGRLAGAARLSRREGDLLIPGDPPTPLGLRTLVLDLNATPISANASRLDAKLNVVTEKMGVVSGTGSAVLLVDAKGGMALDARQPLRAKLDADIADLGWLGLFVGDTMEVGGTLKANLEAQGTLAGKWSASGNIRGDKLRVVRIDDGVRLIDGTLAARVNGDTLVLDSLRFPASLRVMPAEWRTKEWITTNPGAKDGYAEAKGQSELHRRRRQRAPDPVPVPGAAALGPLRHGVGHHRPEGGHAAPGDRGRPEGRRRLVQPGDPAGRAVAGR